MQSQRSENIDALNTDAAELYSRYLAPIGIILVLVVIGLVVYFYYLFKKGKNPALDKSKVRPSLPLEIDVIEEVDEEESSSGIASSVGHRQISRKPTSEFALTTQPDEVFVRF